jgi:hypothetical protein
MVLFRAGRERLIDRAIVPATILAGAGLTLAWAAYLMWQGWLLLKRVL